MTDDPDTYRAAAEAMWDRAASGWARQAARFDAAVAPVTAALLAAAELAPGQRVVELAAGPGSVGIAAAQAVAPGGTALISDLSEPMLEAARAAAEAAGAANVEFAQLGLEWLDLPTASTDRIVCRFGLMLAADPDAALRECRRVLRPGGRLALAAWAAPEDNPWSTAGTDATVDLGLAEPLDRDGPGMWAFAASGRIEALLAGAGFLEAHTEPVPFLRRYADLDEWWEERIDLAVPFAELLARLPPADRDRLREEIDARLGAFAGAGGALEVPGRALVASAGA